MGIRLKGPHMRQAKNRVLSRRKQKSTYKWQAGQQRQLTSNKMRLRQMLEYATISFCQFKFYMNNASLRKILSFLAITEVELSVVYCFHLHLPDQHYKMHGSIGLNNEFCIPWIHILTAITNGTNKRVRIKESRFLANII